MVHSVKYIFDKLRRLRNIIVDILHGGKIYNNLVVVTNYPSFMRIVGSYTNQARNCVSTARNLSGHTHETSMTNRRIKTDI